LRDIPARFDPAIVAAIDARLDGVECENHVRILLAIESGSRAWGFPSPDSDYDSRFIYVRGRDDYLSPWLRRDVIETPLDAILDVNGWDLGKALKLVLKGNAVVIEWLQSPIIYRGDPAFRAAMLNFAGHFADRASVARHYLHLGERQYRTYFAEGKQIALKKVFYSLRPAAALRWLRLHPDQTVAPMHFPTLIAASDMPKDVVVIVDELLARKAVTKELGEAPLPPPIRDFIESEFAVATRAFAPSSSRVGSHAIQAAEALFRRFLN
jgi:predicted nucleotidyltransferase